MTRIGWIMLGTLVMPLGASANDSLGRVGAGGLVLEKTGDIQMVSEVLEISTTKIHVTYHFLNTADHAIKTTVAFPMPAFDDSGVIDGGRENQRPLDSFKTWVNGAPVGLKMNRVFLINKIDVTGKLRKIGLSEAQIFDPEFSCFNDYNDNAPCHHALTAAQQAAIEKLNTGGDWQIQETAYWEQTFPAGKDIEVVHEYKPFTGFHYGGPQNGDPGESCLDDVTRNAIGRRAQRDERGMPTTREVEYILGTGRNWKGPIKHFRLILRKDSPYDVVSLCFPGKPKKTSPVTIEFNQEDYVPQDKLVVYFY